MLGFDDTMSTDHDWTARVVLHLDNADSEIVGTLQEELAGSMPPRYGGVPTNVEVATVADYFQTQLGLDISQQWDAYDWISLAEHRLCEITSGAVFHDEVGLHDIRKRLSYYPRDVWYYLLGAAWWRVHPELNLVGRTGYVGDDVGSSLIAAEMVSALMHLSFLIERRYAPYRKWLGTAFARLQIASNLLPKLQQVLRSQTWQEREQALTAAYSIVAEACNDLRLTDAVPLKHTRMWQRPFTVSWADFPTALTAQIQDPTTRAFATNWSTASGVDQVREILWTPRGRPAVRQLAANWLPIGDEGLPTRLTRRCWPSGGGASPVASSVARGGPRVDIMSLIGQPDRDKRPAPTDQPDHRIDRNQFQPPGHLALGGSTGLGQPAT
ncbi:hypothetical protein JOE57_000061 [Microlunatus panaciterrae]|uniref:DUF4037 domain-containing protein n=1 Tax=Microlunatus panaciterrae TaxID=400768 RepID=A0ABS2RDR9_9ACTN|nr:hypothetical protein [Microlunatus panaciterrae]